MKPITIATFAVVVIACTVPTRLAAQASSPALKGVALGKADYVPHMFQYLRPDTMPTG